MNQCTVKGVNAPVVNQSSMDHTPNYSYMLTDNSEGEHEIDILGDKLVTVPVTFMEKNNEAICGASNSETLAAEVGFNVSCGITRDMQKNQGTET